MTKVTIYDVATEAGMSPSTISRILRGGQGHVYPEATQERVREIAKRMGYRANAAARLLSQGTPSMIGLAVHFTEHPYLNRYMIALHQELMEHDYDAIFLDGVQLAEGSEVQPFPPPHMLAGLISLGIDLQFGWPKFYAELRRHVPIVAVQPVSKEASEWVDVVHVDFHTAYRRVFEHLIQLGHKNIAYLSVMEAPNPSDRCKDEGWISASRELKLSEEFRIPWNLAKSGTVGLHSESSGENDFMYQADTRGSMEKVVNSLGSFREPITALICASDEVAIGMQSYLQSLGWQLPRDLSIVGYDGISLGEHVYPSLTTIEPDYAQTAKVAVAHLMELLGDKKGAGIPSEHLVTPKLVVRNSTGPAPTAPIRGKALSKKR